MNGRCSTWSCEDLATTNDGARSALGACAGARWGDGDLLVRTSGFDYKDWRGPFYPRFIKGGDRLAYFAEHFDTVELNVTF
jgi:hypothetical protein